MTTPRKQAAESAIDIVKRRAAEAEANRLAMPEVSRWINLQEAQFGKSKVRYASEGEIIRGRRGQFYEVSADQMVLYVDGKQIDWSSHAVSKGTQNYPNTRNVRYK